MKGKNKHAFTTGSQQRADTRWAKIQLKTQTFIKETNNPSHCQTLFLFFLTQSSVLPPWVCPFPELCPRPFHKLFKRPPRNVFSHIWFEIPCFPFHPPTESMEVAEKKSHTHSKIGHEFPVEKPNIFSLRWVSWLWDAAEMADDSCRSCKLKGCVHTWPFPTTCTNISMHFIDLYWRQLSAHCVQWIIAPFFSDNATRICFSI